MATIVISHDPSGIKGKDIHTVDGCVVQWILDKYPEGFGVPTKIFRDSITNEIDLRDYPDGLITDSVITISHQPAGAEVIGYVAIALVVSYFVAKAVSDQYETPEDVDTNTAGSPNNKINGQTNLIRALEKVPQIYGKVKSYPDILLPSYGRWIDNQYVLFEYFMLSDGNRQNSITTDVKRGDNELYNSGNSVYPPDGQYGGLPGGQDNGHNVVDLFQSPSLTAYTANVRTIENTEGLYLKGTNIGGDTAEFLVQSGASQTFNRTTGRVGYKFVSNAQVVDTSYIQLAAGTSATGWPDYVSFRSIINKLNPGDLLTLDFDNDFPEPDVNGGTYAYESHFESTNGSNSYFLNIKFSDMTVTPVEGGIDGGNLVSMKGNNVEAPGQKIYGLFTTPMKSSGVFINVSAPSGMIAANGDRVEAYLTYGYQQIDGSANGVGFLGVEGQSRTPQNKTFTIPFPTAGLYNVDIYRDNVEDVEAGAADKVYCDSIQAVQSVTSSNGFDEDDTKTTLFVKTKVEDDSIRSGKVNAIHSRAIPVFNYTTGAYDDQAFTDRFDHILIYHMNIVAGVPLDQIALDDLESIVNDVGVSSDLLKFNYTFAGKNTPLNDDVSVICNAVRVTPYKQGSLYRFFRDQLKPVSTVFAMTDKKHGADKKTIKPNLLNDYDGIELEYKDNETDFDSVILNVPVSALRRKKIKTVGITNTAQAQNRADYEYNRLMYQRTSFTTTVLKTGVIPDLGDRIIVPDNTRIDSQSCEVLKIDGATMTVSETIDFKGSSNGSFYFSGGVLTVEPVSGNVVTITAGSTASLESRGQNGNQKGSSLVFVNGSTNVGHDWTLTNRTDDGDYVTLECVNYDERVYDGD